MMTFIVTACFTLNARLLDNQRLGKQRIEAKTIIDIIESEKSLVKTGESTKKRAWSNHPATLAWIPYLNALKYYANCIIIEWINRGKINNIPLYDLPPVILMPWWASWERLHQSHRAMLMRKQPSFYHDKFTVDPEYMLYGYIWPHNINYDQRDAPLSTITAEIPKELINPVFCCGILKSGIRKGEECQQLIRDNHTLCKKHRKK